jgi:hypothetical protein
MWYEKGSMKAMKRKRASAAYVPKVQGGTGLGGSGQRRAFVAWGKSQSLAMCHPSIFV